MSNSSTNATSNATNVEIFDVILHLVDKIEVHQVLCREVVTLALQAHPILYQDADWNCIIQEIDSSIREWANMGSLESFLKCDIIAGKLISLRMIIYDFCGISSNTLPSFNDAFLSDGTALIPSLLAIFSAPNALDAFNTLPSVHRDIAASLLRRVLSSLPSETTSLKELILGCLKGLEDRDVEINLDLPDLSDEIKLVQSQPVSSGQYGDVYLAKRGNSLVSVRVLKTFNPSDTRGYKALERDLKLRVSLLHPNLLPFYGICSTNLGTCMVSPYMPNGNANIYLECHPEASAIGILSGAANGLQYLHSCWPSISHGDIRGANILISSTGNALLADHSLSNIIDEKRNSQAPYGAIASLNANINLAGIRWAAPEIVCKEDDLRRLASSPPPQDSASSPKHQMAGYVIGEDALIEVVTPMSDVWSFGMTIYELLTNRTPFYQHARVETVISAISLNERPLPPSSQNEVRNEWQPELWTLMQECWTVDRRQRLSMDVIAKRMTVILSKSMVTHDSLERARSPSSLSDRMSPTLAHARPGSVLRAKSPSASSPRHKSRIVHSTSNSSLSSQALRSSSTTPSPQNNMSSPSPTTPSSRPRSPNSILPSYKARNSASDIYEGNGSSSTLSATGSSGKAASDLHPFSVTISGTVVEWSKLSLTQRRVFLDNCRAEGTSSPSTRTNSPTQSIPSSPPRSLSPGSSQNGYQKRPRETEHVLMPIRASPLTSEAISLPSKLARTQLSKIIIPVTIGSTSQNPSSPDTPQPVSGVTSSGYSNDVHPSRSRTSAPMSVHSDKSHTTYFSDEPFYAPREQSFDIVAAEEDDSTLDRTIENGNFISPTSNDSSDMLASHMGHGYQHNDWMAEAFAQANLVSTAKPSGPIPEDILSNSSSSRLGHSESAHQFAQGLDIRIDEPEPRPLSEEIQACRELVEQIMREEAEFITTQPERGFLLWVGQSENTRIPFIMAQQAEIGILDAYKNVANTHHQLREAVISPDDLLSLEEYSEFFEQHEKGLAPLLNVYRDYVEALSNLNDILTNALDGNFGQLHEIDSARCLRLSSKLRTPFHRISKYAASLGTIAESLSRAAPHQDLTAWKEVAISWRHFSLQIPLLAWQASLGRGTLVSFELNDLYPRSATDQEAVFRRGTYFRLIERQSKFVGEAQLAGKRLEALSAQNPSVVNLLAIPTSLSEIYRLHLSLLDELYRHQQGNHPQLPTIVPILCNAVALWDEAYTAYCRLISPVLKDAKTEGNLEVYGNFEPLLMPPLNHLRDLLRDVKTLLDISDDQADIEPTQQLIHSLQELIKASREILERVDGEEDVTRLVDLLSWESGGPPTNVDLYHVSRRIIHKGVLHYPVDPSGTRVSIDDRGSSVQVLVVLLDNCILVTDPIVRHGIERLFVKATLHLDDIFLPDSEITRASQQQIFLLDSENGKKIAAPVLLRYRDQLAPRSIVPRPRAASTASALGIRVEDGMHLLYPKELLLLANSAMEGAEWRSRLAAAKVALGEIGVKPIASRNMFKLIPTTTLPFEPSSSADFFVDGKKATLICAESGQGGIFVMTNNDELQTCITAVQAKQCCVIDELRIAIVLVAKSLWALKLEELMQPEPPHPVIIKNHASLFRVGYQRGQLLLVIASDTTKGTAVKWYTTSSRMNRPSLALSSGIFGRSKKLFRLLGEQEIQGMIHGLEILDCGIVAMGVSGFHLINTDQAQADKIQDMPHIRAGASSDAAQRCRTSKALGAIRSENEILLCYSDFGVYVSTAGEIVGRAIDWTSSRILNVVFAAPYFFLIAENHVEVRLVETGRRLEALEGKFFKVVRGVNRAYNPSMGSPMDGQSMADFSRRPLEDDGGLVQLAAHCEGSESNVGLVELQMEVLDLAP